MPSSKARGGRRRIPPPSIPGGGRHLQFSFRHLQTDNPKFDLKDCPDEFFRALMRTLCTYSNQPVDDFLNANNNEHRHQIFFDDTTEKDGFNDAPGIDKDQTGYLEAWQFEVCEQTDWRVHGFIIDATFYIVWLDPLHRLYPREATSCFGAEPATHT